MRSPVTVTLTAAGSTNWVPVDQVNAPFSLSLQVIPSSNFSGTAITVQHTYDSLGLDGQRGVTFSQTATTVTITDTGVATGQTGPGGTTGHGMASGDSVILLNTAQQALAAGKVSIDGQYTVTVTSATQYTITVTPSQTFVGSALANNLRVQQNPTITGTGVTVRTDAQYQYPVRAIRLSAATLTAGSVDMVAVQGIAL